VVCKSWRRDNSFQTARSTRHLCNRGALQRADRLEGEQPTGMTFPMKVSEIVAPEAALMVTREEKSRKSGFLRLERLVIRQYNRPLILTSKRCARSRSPAGSSDRERSRPCHKRARLDEVESWAYHASC